MDDEKVRDDHLVWEDIGCWWTDYPPPPGFDGEEIGFYGDHDYRRSLSPAEQAVMEAEQALDQAEAEARRDAFFGFSPAPPEVPADAR